MVMCISAIEELCSTNGSEAGIYSQADLTELFVERKNYLLGFARKIVRGDGECEDVVQEAYCRASRNLHRFEGRSTLLSWVCSIVRNEALTMLRRRRGHEHQSIDTDFEHPEQIAVSGPREGNDPEQMCMHAEEFQRVQSRMTELPAEVQTIFDLYYMKECSLEEVAQCRSKSVAAIKSHLHRGKAALRHNVGTLRHYSSSRHAAR